MLDGQAKLTHELEDVMESFSQLSFIAVNQYQIVSISDIVSDSVLLLDKIVQRLQVQLCQPRRGVVSDGKPLFVGVNHLEDDLQELFVFDFLPQTGFQFAVRNGRVELAYVHLHAVLGVFSVPDSSPLHTLGSMVDTTLRDVGTAPMIGRPFNDRLEDLHNGVVCALVRVERRDL